MAKKTRKELLKQEDAFLSAANKSAEWLQGNKRPVIGRPWFKSEITNPCKNIGCGIFFGDKVQQVKLNNQRCLKNRRFKTQVPEL